MLRIRPAKAARTATRTAVAAAAPVALALSVGTPSRSATPSIVAKPAADAYVSPARPRENHGRDRRLRVGRGRRAYVRFIVPAAATRIRHARLVVHTAGAIGSELTVSTATGGWRERTITYANAPRPSRTRVVRATVGRHGSTSVDVTALLRATKEVTFAFSAARAHRLSLASRESGRRGPRLRLDVGDPVVGAAGDIACDPADPNFNGARGRGLACHMKATSDLLLGLKPTAVLALGDLQYEDGAAAKFAVSYDRTWGRLHEITRPAVGNHEYLTAAARGYFAYFGPLAGEPDEGYYSFDLGRWHIVSVNSNCSRIGGCDEGSPEERWLRADLRAHPAACTLAYWHHPRFSSGHHGNTPAMQPIWQTLYDAGADVVLTGHDHDYERFAPQRAGGTPDPARGIREFVVGTGGRNLTSIRRTAPNSEARSDAAFGVLELVLHPRSYEWRFVGEAASAFSDAGSARCH